MEITQMVCTYLQAKELKKLGVAHDSFFVWGDATQFDDEGEPEGFIPILMQPSTEEEFEWETVKPVPDSLLADDEGGVTIIRNFPAYTSDELLDILPGDSQYTLCRNKDMVFHYRTTSYGNFAGKTAAEALAAALISLLQQGVLEVKDAVH